MSSELQPIETIAEGLGLLPEELEPLGRFQAKVRADSALRRARGTNARLVLVTALTPTRAGDGKTCVAIGLSDALRQIGRRSVVCLRQPSLGPIFGIKGGATGGGRAEVLPMEAINLHFTGDFHAITQAHNLLAALIDNHVHFGNELGIEPERMPFRRVLDLCDRQLRYCQLGLGGKAHGFPHETGFDITAASEIMAICALARDLEDLSRRLSRIVIGDRKQGGKVTLDELGVVSALVVLLRDVLLPNLVQTSERGPALVHLGPFANIAHGASSLIATELGLATADFVVTEAGFGADLGAEKFLHIKCKELGFMPAVAVLVVTCRALKHHGGVAESDYAKENLEALEVGFDNVRVHLENLRKFGLPVVVGVNRFPFDTDRELARVGTLCDGAHTPHAVADVVARGGVGGLELATIVESAAAFGNRPCAPLYQASDSLRQKIEILARELYRADGVDYDPKANQELDLIEANGLGRLGVCMAKTQYSLSDDAQRLNVPGPHRIRVRSVLLRAGAGYVVPKTGHIELMPGMPKHGAVFRIGLDADGRVKGLG